MAVPSSWEGVGEDGAAEKRARSNFMWWTLPANVPLGVFWRARCRGSNETLPERGGIVLGGEPPAHSLAYGLRLGRGFEKQELALKQVPVFQIFVTPTGFKPITF